MDFHEKIFKQLKQRGSITTAELVKQTGFSRAYAHRILKQFRDEGKIVLLGKANQARYVLADQTSLETEKRSIRAFHRLLKNEELSEDMVLGSIKRETGIFLGTHEELDRVIGYGFTKMLNNAIEHSRSDKIEIKLARDESNITFSVRDFGVGIYNNVMKKKKLKSELEAIQDLLKGKLTTDPKHHSGEGIFFTSKAADFFVIESGKKRLQIDNKLPDVFIQDIKQLTGTRVVFSISLDTQKTLQGIFQDFTDRKYKFNKTQVVIKLFQLGTDFISRSEARRVFAGLDSFKEIILDFQGVKTIGQAFADQVFRVWQSQYPAIILKVKNAHENVRFMIDRAKRGII